MAAGNQGTASAQLAKPLTDAEWQQANQQVNPHAVRIRQLRQDTINAGRAANRMPQLAAQPDPYVQSQREFRDWVLRRAGADEASARNALRGVEAENNAARTAAYLQSVQGNQGTASQRVQHQGRALDETVRHNQAVEEQRRLEMEERRRRAALAAAAGRMRGEEKAKDKAAAQLSKDVTGLRKEFNAQSTVKAFAEIQAAVQKMEEAASQPSAAGDLSAIFAYMKLLDPGSAVRESEFANASNAAGVPDRIRNQWNKAKSGERLTAAQRADFVGQARKLYAVHRRQYGEQAERYRALAQKAGGDPDDVVRLDGGGAKAPAAGASATSESQPKGGMVTVRQKSTGVTKTLSADRAEWYLSDPDFEEVK